MNISQNTVLHLYGLVRQMEARFRLTQHRNLRQRPGETFEHAWAKHVEFLDAEASWYEHRARDARDLILGIPDAEWDEPLPFDADPPNR